MPLNRFLFRLISITAVSFLIVLGSQSIPYFEGTFLFTIVGIVFFLVLTLIVFYAGQRAAKSSDVNSLTRLIMGLVFVKLFCCVILVAVYHKLFNPTDNHYLILFFLIYVIYTAFEVRLLGKINRAHGSQNPEAEV